MKDELDLEIPLYSWWQILLIQFFGIEIGEKNVG